MSKKVLITENIQGRMFHSTTNNCTSLSQLSKDLQVVQTYIHIHVFYPKTTIP